MKPLLTKLWRSSTQRVMSLSGVGMVLALLMDVLIVRSLGFSAVTDTLILALTLPRLIGTVGRDATKFSLMTVFIKSRKEQGEDAFIDLGARVLNLFLGLGLILSLAGLLLAGPLMAAIGWGLEPEYRTLGAALLRILSGIALLALGSAVLEVLLNSQKYFTATAIRNAVTPVVVILATAFTWQQPHAPYWIAWAFLGGYAFYFLLLVAHSYRRLGFVPNPTLWPRRDTLQKLRGTIAYPLAGFGVRQGAKVAERAILTLAPPGSVTCYFYAYRLLAALQNLVGVSIALTGQPKLTEHDLAGDRAAFFALLRKRIGIALAISIPAAILLMSLSGPIVHILYGQKHSDPGMLATTAGLLMLLSPLAVTSCVIPVLNSALYAAGRYGTVLYNMTLAATANVTLAWFLFNSIGLNGVAFAALAASVISISNLTWLVTRRTRSGTTTTP